MELGLENIDHDVMQAALVPLVMGLTQVVKQLNVPNRFLPVAALIFGALAAFFVIPSGHNDLLHGLIAGLSAAGLYRGAKVVVNGA